MNPYILLIIGLVLTVISGLISLLKDKKKRNEPNAKSANRFNLYIFIIIVIGAILTFLSSITSIRDAEIADKNENRWRYQDSLLKDSIVTLGLKIEKLTNRNFILSEKLDSLAIKTGDLALKISDRTSQMDDYLKGVGSFCYLTLGGPPAPNHEAYQYMLFSEGRNPLQNVNARVVEIGDTSLNTNIFQLGDIYPRHGYITLLGIFYKPHDQEKISLNIFFQTGNREFIETLREIKVNNKWSTKIEVMEDNGRKLFQKIDSNWPQK